MAGHSRRCTTATLARSHMDTRLDPTQARTPRLASDFRRLLFSAAIGVPATAAAEGPYLAFSGSGLSVVAVVVAAYIFSAASSLAHFITTFAIFQNADAESLARWVAATAPTGRLSSASRIRRNWPDHFSAMVGSCHRVGGGAGTLARPPQAPAAGRAERCRGDDIMAGHHSLVRGSITHA